MIKVETSNFLIKVLGKNVKSNFVFIGGSKLGPEFNLGKDLKELD